MNKYQITDESFLNQVKQWIELDGDIYLDIYILHSGGGAINRLITSPKEFDEVISSVQGAKGEITIVRHADFKFRGIANANLLDKAIGTLSDGQEWGLACPDPDNVFRPNGAQGTTHQQLREAFKRFNNKYIAIDNNQDDYPPDREPRNKEKVYVLEFG